MVRLTDYEQRMLSGEMGKLKQIAIKNVVEYAEILGAEELCVVTKAHVGGLGDVSLYSYNMDGTETFEDALRKLYFFTDEPIKLEEFSRECFSQTDGGPTCLYEYEALGHSKELFDSNWEACRKMTECGLCVGGTCTPYFAGFIPMRGENYVTTESSAVIVLNSVFGARGNAAGTPMAVWGAICARAPKWGNHVEENKRGTHVYRLKCQAETALDWDVIGYMVGRMLPPRGVPVLVGDFPPPDIVRFKQMCGAMATTSAAEMCHIVGVTPDALTLEQALGGREPEEVITVTQKDFDENFALLCDEGSGDVQLVTLGCPHYSLQEIQDLAIYIKGKKIKDGVKLFVWTNPGSKELARLNGFEKIISDAGGKICTNGCILLHGEGSRVPKASVTGVVVDAAKQAHYLRTQYKQAKMFFGSMEQCVDAAVKGRWEA